MSASAAIDMKIVTVTDDPAPVLGHELEPALGKGVGRALLRHIVAEAESRGYKRLSLETGNTEPFHPALRLYESEGFVPWGPFADYNYLPFSSFMTRRL